MATGWKEQDHRTTSSHYPSSTHSHGSHDFGNEASGYDQSTADSDQNDVPQRPPTVGQELPNNLDWPLDAQPKSARSRKRGNLDKNRDKILDTSGDGRSSDGVVPATVWPPPPLPYPSTDHSRQTALDCEAGSTSDGDANLRCTSNRGARPKKDYLRKKDLEQVQSDNDLRRSHKVPVNQAKMLNTNQVVGKLSQIRDYIKQVTGTVEALQKSGDTGNTMRAERLNSEFSSMGLYANISCTSDGSVGGSAADIEEDFGVEDDGEAVAFNNSKLLRQVAESEEKLKSLEKQNAVILGMQHGAEGRVVQARPVNGKSTENNDKSREFTPELLNASYARLLHDEFRHGTQSDLQNNRNRVELLSRSGDGVGRSITELPTESQKRELHDKQLDLQHNNRQIDELLRKLCLLSETRVQDSPSTPGESAFQKHPKKSSCVSKEDDASFLQVGQTDKIFKIDEMKSWLQTLQDMAFRHQTAPNFPGLSSHSAIGNDTLEAHSHGSERLPLKSEKLKKPKANNISRERSNDCVVRLSTYWSGHDQIQPERIDDEDEDDDDSLDENDSDLNKKISAARRKLEKLQELLSIAQQTDHSNQQFNAQYVEEQLNAIECGNQPVYNVMRANEAPDSPTSSSSLFRVPGKSHLESISDVQRSRSRSSVTTASNHNPNQSGNARRLSVDVSWSNQNSPMTMTNARRNSNVVTSTHAVPGRSFHPTTGIQTSNQELWAEMKHQMALREEIRHWELDGIIHKGDTSHKNYLLNQDNHSENTCMSTLVKSDLHTMNATDGTTAATWGGSSVDNGARDMLDVNDIDSQEEPNRLPNEADCSSDEGVEVDNSVLTATPQFDVRRSKAQNGSSIKEQDSTCLAAWRAPNVTPSHCQVTRQETGDLNAPLDQFNGSTNLRSSSRGRCMCPDRLKHEGVQAGLGVQLNRPQMSIDNSHNRGYHQQQLHEQPRRESTTAYVRSPGVIASQEQQQQQPTADTTQLRHQLESVMLLCNSLLSDQHTQAFLSNQLTSSPLEAREQPPTSIGPDLLQPQYGQIVVQQLLLGLSQCYHLLYLQQVDIQRLQQMLHSTISADHVSCSSEGQQCWLPNQSRSIPPSNSEAPVYSNVEIRSSSRWHRDDPPPMARSSVSSSSSQLPPPSSDHQHHMMEPNFLLMSESVSLPLPTPPPPPPTSLLPTQSIQNLPQYHQSNNEMLNNQVPPGNRANNYWDNFRSYSRQNLLSTTTTTTTGSSSVFHPNESNDCQVEAGHCMTCRGSL